MSVSWLGYFVFTGIKSQFPNQHNELQVFNDDNQLLYGYNIVDWIVTVPLQLELKRVDWSDRILSVDFEAVYPLNHLR